MKRPLRCMLIIHKWVIRQDSSDAPRYIACARCGTLKLLDPLGGNGELGRNLLLDDDRER